MCGDNAKLQYEDNIIKGDDVFFNIPVFLDEKSKGYYVVVALNSQGVDSISLNDLGCVKNCYSSLDTISYIGKINQKNRVSMRLHFDKNEVSGYYYYDKIKERIKITGFIKGRSMELQAMLPEGNEKFIGVLDDGQYNGEWKNVKGDRKYSFSLYKKLIQ